MLRHEYAEALASWHCDRGQSMPAFVLSEAECPHVPENTITHHAPPAMEPAVAVYANATPARNEAARYANTSGYAPAYESDDDQPGYRRPLVVRLAKTSPSAYVNAQAATSLSAAASASSSQSPAAPLSAEATSTSKLAPQQPGWSDTLWLDSLFGYRQANDSPAPRYEALTPQDGDQCSVCGEDDYRSPKHRPVRLLHI